MDDKEIKNKRFADFLSSVPKEELMSLQEADFKKTEQDFLDFCEGFSKGKCSLCGFTLSHFAKNKPCLHWLLGPYGPKGFKKKKHFLKLCEEFSYHQIDSYCKWVANYEKPFFNINNIEEDKDKDKKIQHTVKYKDLEWSFSCTENDFTGHKGTRFGETPHFHFQMKVSGRVVIGFNDFHIPFNEYDFFMFDIANGTFGEDFGYHAGLGSGMQEFFDLPNDKVFDLIKYTGNEEEGDVRVQTVVTAQEGETIKGDDIIALLEEQEKTGESMATLSRKLKNVQVQAVLTPSDKSPEISKRTPRKRGKNRG